LVYKIARLNSQTINSRILQSFERINNHRKKKEKVMFITISEHRKGNVKDEEFQRKDQIDQASASSTNQEDQGKSPAAVSFLNLPPNNSTLSEKVKRGHFHLALLKNRNNRSKRFHVYRVKILLLHPKRISIRTIL
jgi:ssDNA-specific exonuclease RecJ